MKKLLFTSTVLAAFSVGVRVSAQPTPADADMERAEAAYRQRDYATAQRILQSRWEATHDLTAGRRLIVTEVALTRWDDVERHATDYLARPEAETHHQSDVVRNHLALARQNLGTLTLMGSVVGATVIVDGRPRGTLPLTTPLSLMVGNHVIEVVADGYFPFERTVRIAAGRTLQQPIELTARRSDVATMAPPPVVVPVVAQPVVAPTGLPRPAPQSPAHDVVPSHQAPLRLHSEAPHGRWMTPLSATLLTLGGLGLGIGIMSFVQRSDTIEDFNANAACGYNGGAILGGEACEALNARAERREQLAVVGIAAGGALVIGGIVIGALAPRASSRPTVAVDAHGFRAEWVGHF